jgi:hypothetical protein
MTTSVTKRPRLMNWKCNICEILGVNSIYVLQCSTPYENVVKNNDPFTHSYEGNHFTFSNLIIHCVSGINTSHL